MLVRSGIIAVALFSLAPAAQAQSNTAAGALIGGATGAIIGGAVTGRAGGAAAGAVIGGATGAIIGSQADRPQPRYVWGRDGRCYLQQPSGEVVRVSRANCG